jgi:hypothetical protein
MHQAFKAVASAVNRCVEAVGRLRCDDGFECHGESCSHDEKCLTEDDGCDANAAGVKPLGHGYLCLRHMLALSKSDLIQAHFTNPKLQFKKLDNVDLTSVIWSYTTCPDATNISSRNRDAHGGNCAG